MDGVSFAALFRSYRLRSEIATLCEFGDLLAEEGLVYETSLFSRWQSGERVPRDRHILLKILHVFLKRGGIRNQQDINRFFESAGQGYMTEHEQEHITLPQQSA